MNEKQFTTKFGLWLKENKPDVSCAIELKSVKGNTFNIKQWLEKQGHQFRELTHATNDIGVYHKISDQSSGQKPFDAFFFVNAHSFLVIYFQQQKKFFMIPHHYLFEMVWKNSIHFNELNKDLQAHELLKPKKLEIPNF